MLSLYERRVCIYMEGSVVQSKCMCLWGGWNMEGIMIDSNTRVNRDRKKEKKKPVEDGI